MTAATRASALDWLMDADPSIRWQVLQDLLDAPAEEIADERARVAHEGWGARILELQWPDGSWNGGACFPRPDAEPEFQPWTGTMWALRQLVDCGADPDRRRHPEPVEHPARASGAALVGWRLSRAISLRRGTGSANGSGWGRRRYARGMLLSDRDIRAEIDAGRIGLDPLDLGMVQPSSVDVRLDRFFRLFDNHKYPFIDPAEEQPELTRLIETRGDEPFILHPGEFVLGSTFELVSLPGDVAARLEGKSSLGRLGLLTHSTAGFVDPGFSGHVTLELSNVATLPIKLWPGMKIGQLCFFRTSSPVENPYGSGAYGNRYQGQRGPTASRSFQSFHRVDVRSTDAGARGQ